MLALFLLDNKNFSQRKVFCGAFFQKSDHPAPAGAPLRRSAPRTTRSSPAFVCHRRHAGLFFEEAAEIGGGFEAEGKGNFLDGNVAGLQ